MKARAPTGSDTGGRCQTVRGTDCRSPERAARPPFGYLSPMDDAAARRRARQETWQGQVFRGPDALARLEVDAEREWAAFTPVERLALVWELSVAQYGGSDGGSVESRLPRSAYRLERR